MYGHLDKQPEFSGWRSDLGPWTPKYEDGKLYGRGGADDGYAVYASIAAVQELKRQRAPPRIVGLIETCEESGSRDLMPYIDALRPRLGDVGLVICLDSGAGNYDQLWLTTSLRGMASGTLKVEILTEGIHSGDASGLVPSSFRIMRQVLDRLETASHWPPAAPELPLPGACRPPGPGAPRRPSWAKRCTALSVGALRLRRLHHLCAAHHHRPGAGPAQSTWEPTLSVTGAEGFPPLQDAGNVLRPTPPSSSACACPRWWMPPRPCKSSKPCSKTTPPTRPRSPSRPAAAPRAGTPRPPRPGLSGRSTPPRQAHFGAALRLHIGQGGTIPLMNMLRKASPPREMMVCGVLEPQATPTAPTSSCACLRQAPHRLGGACDGRHGPRHIPHLKALRLPQPP